MLQTHGSTSDATQMSIVAVPLEDPTNAFNTRQRRRYHHVAVIVLLDLPWQSAIVEGTDVVFNLMQKFLHCLRAPLPLVWRRPPFPESKARDEDNTEYQERDHQRGEGLVYARP